MEFREMMWELFVSTGNLDAYLAYRACIELDLNSGEEQNSALNFSEECQPIISSQIFLLP